MKERLLELDILRGLSILGMILVITPGDWSQRFQWMNHADWRGYPLSDMIFPSFLFCVGMSIAISFYKRKQNNDSIKSFIKIIKRTLILIVLGLLVNGFPSYDFQNIRIPGVLQRIALCYLIVASIYLFLKYKKVKRMILWLVIISCFILIGYYLLLYHIPINGIGIAGDSSYNSWPVTIDQKVFGIHHLFKFGTTNGQVTYDPEGILASFPASVNVILGLIIGLLYTQNRNQYSTIIFFISGVLLILFGVGLDYFEIMPSVKKIWTSSFVLFSGGFSLLVFAFIRLLLTYVPTTKNFFYPFIIYGANAILAFIISNMLLPVFDIPIHNVSIRKRGYDFFNLFVSNNQWRSFLFSVTFLVLLFILLQVLYKKRIFLKV